jgi:hypothetical protein
MHFYPHRYIYFININMITMIMLMLIYINSYFLELSAVLDEDAEQFVVKLWRMLIYSATVATIDSK